MGNLLFCVQQLINSGGQLNLLHKHSHNDFFWILLDEPATISNAKQNGGQSFILILRTGYSCIEILGIRIHFLSDIPRREDLHIPEKENTYLREKDIQVLSQVRIGRPSFPSELFPFSWKMRTVLNRMKNQFSYFCHF